MVHTGKPSRGCAVCRKRRIKCDEKVPECSYCIKTKQKCPGYRDAFDLAWRDQTTVAKNSVERRKRAVRNENLKVIDNVSVFPTNAVGLLKYSRPIASLSENLEDVALDFYFQNYSIPGNSSYASRSWSEYVAPMFAASPDQSVLRMSVMAFAGALLLAWLDRKPDTPLSRAYYLKAVSILKNNIARQEVADDEILLSVLLLQMYEVMIGSVRRLPSPTAHLDGALALIRHRGIASFRTPGSREMLFEVRNQLINESFRTTKPLSPDVTLWSEQLDDNDLSPLIRLDGINVHLANINAWIMQSSPSNKAWRAEILNAPRDVPPTLDFHTRIPGLNNISQASILALITEVQRLDGLLVAWMLTLPPEEFPVGVSGPECLSPDIPLYQDWAEIHADVYVAHAWSSYRVSRLRAQVLIYTLLGQNSDFDFASPLSTFTDATSSPIPVYTTSPQQSSTSLLATTLATIQNLTDSLCATVPFYFGSRLDPGPLGDRKVSYPHLPGVSVPDDHYRNAPAMGGWQMLGPLSYILGLRAPVREGQKEWVGSQMWRVVKLYNLGK